MLNLTNYIALFGNHCAYSINKNILMKDVILIKHQLEEYNNQENNIKHKQFVANIDDSATCYF